MRTNELCPKKKAGPFQGSTMKSGRKNNFPSKVMCSGPTSQLVVMSIPRGQEIGEETQEDIDQTLFIVAGQGEAVLDGNITTVREHDAVFVPAGTTRNLRSKGNGRLKLFTVYSRCRTAFIF